MPVTAIPAIAAPTGIKSVQRGSITISGAATSNTAAIAAVNTAKAEVRFLGATLTGTYMPGNAAVELTNANTVTAMIGGPNGSNATVVRFEVTEWN